METITAKARGHGKPQNGINHIDVLRIGKLTDIVNDVVFRHDSAVGQGHRLHLHHAPGVHQTAGKQLIQRDDKGIILLRLFHQPCHQRPSITGLGSVGVFQLTVQLGGV